jgi:hypothetical protein
MKPRTARDAGAPRSAAISYRLVENPQDVPVTRPSRRQKAFAAAVAVGTLAYILLAISGTIKPDNRLTAAEVGVVVVAVLAIGVALRPAFLDRLQKFDFAGIKVELGEVKRSQIEVQKQQQEQQAVLEDVRLALRLLIGRNEQDHMFNLFKRETNRYRVSGTLRDEIRRLRAMRLVKMCEGKTVGGMPGNAIFDLADYVELTEDGFKFISHLANRPDIQVKDASATS